MPNKVPLEIANPRNSATLTAYIGYFIFGVLVGPLPFNSVSISTLLPTWSENVWSYSLLVGGGLFIVGAFIGKKRLEVALLFQMAGSSGVFFGLLTYGLAIFLRSGYPNGIPFFVILASLAVASIIRAASCWSELRRLNKVAELPRQTLEVLAEDSDGKRGIL